MTPQDLLLGVFCLVDDELQALNIGRLRQRGPAPEPAGSEALAIEPAGEFGKLGADRAPWRHFRRYHTAELPAPARARRTTFARQAANLWRVTQLPQQRLAGRPAARASATATTGRRGCATGWPRAGWRCWRRTTTGAGIPTRGGRRA